MQRAQSAKSKVAVSFWLLAVPRRVDQDDAATVAEVVGLRRPHVAGHQQARPEHHRLAATADLYAHRAKHGVEPDVLHR